jgi:hypothetical protein
LRERDSQLFKRQKADSPRDWLVLAASSHQKVPVPLA